MATKEIEAAEVAPPKRSKKKLFLIVFILLLFLGGVGAACFWFFQLREPADAAGSKPAAATTESAQPQTVEAPQPLTPADLARPAVNVVTLPTVNVNLMDAANNRYLRLGMDVEVSTPDAVQEIQKQMPRVRDSMIILLSSKSYAELATAEGKMQLKNDIAARLNQILGVPRVVRIYFTDFMVQ